MTPTQCRRTDPYPPLNKLEYRTAKTTGQTAAQASIIRKAVQGHRHQVQTVDGREVKNAKSQDGTLLLQVDGLWISEQPWFVHP